MKSTEAERPEGQSLQPLVGERALELEWASELGAEPQRREEPERLLAQAAEGDLDRSGGGRVEPLDVVESDQHRPLRGRCPDHVQNCEPDCMWIERSLARLGEEQCNLERTSARRCER